MSDPLVTGRLDAQSKKINSTQDSLNKAYARIAALEERCAKLEERLAHVETFLEQGNPHV